MTAIEIFKTIALVAGILIAPFIITALVCVLVVVLGLIISLLRFLFTIEVDDGGGIHECIGCHSYDNIPLALRGKTTQADYCENCKIYKKAQKIIAKRQRREEKETAARQKRQAEDEEQIKYLQEYNRKKREGKK